MVVRISKEGNRKVVMEGDELRELRFEQLEQLALLLRGVVINHKLGQPQVVAEFQGIAIVARVEEALQEMNFNVIHVVK